jgi:hypothetical protein
MCNNLVLREEVTPDSVKPDFSVIAHPSRISTRNCSHARCCSATETLSPDHWADTLLHPYSQHDGKNIFALNLLKHGELVRCDKRTKTFLIYASGLSAEGISFRGVTRHKRVYQGREP